MAERGADRDSRRQHFRKVVAESSLSQDYHDRQEGKRRQLDDSIHKYIASKEREFKTFEKELRHGYKLSYDRETTTRHRTSSESTADPSGSPMLAAQSKVIFDAYASSVLRGERNKQKLEGADRQDRLESVANSSRHTQSDQAFTPSRLLALERDQAATTPRTSSAPPDIDKVAATQLDGATTLAQIFLRANSDPVVSTNKAKNPAILTLASRTSSSGSSVDGRLASAMKPTGQPPKPKGKRVSLAVGDAIVAPSDNVPFELAHNSTPSHSRIRSPVLEQSIAVKDFQTNGIGGQDKSLDQQVASTSHNGAGLGAALAEARSNGQSCTPSDAKAPRPDSRSVPVTVGIDPDGDLSFDLEHDEDEDEPHARYADLTMSDEDAERDIAGRVVQPQPPSPRERGTGRYYESSEGLLPEPVPAHLQADHESPISLGPVSDAASQHPTNLGFRRPSVTHDPVYQGVNYASAEERAVEDDVYGSSYARPGSKGSFTAGSVGESLMDRFHSERQRLGAPA